jgi:hypothetical protein
MPTLYFTLQLQELVLRASLLFLLQITFAMIQSSGLTTTIFALRLCCQLKPLHKLGASS